MKYIILALSLAVGIPTANAHPIERLVEISDDISTNQWRVNNCNRVIKNSPSLVTTTKDCEYVAKTGAKVLCILSDSLEAEGLDVNRKNRKKLVNIAWHKLGFGDFSELLTFAFNDTLEDASKYIGSTHPEMVMKYLDKETIEKFKAGGIL